MRTILVVDDDPAFRWRLRRVLESAGYAVLGASDAQEASEVLGEMRDSLDAVVVDLVLPSYSGYELIGRIAERAPHIKLLATTGVVRQPYLEAATSFGAHATIEKGADDAAWLATIDQLLNRGAAQA